MVPALALGTLPEVLGHTSGPDPSKISTPEAQDRVKTTKAHELHRLFIQRWHEMRGTMDTH